MFLSICLIVVVRSGAAGNFVAPIEKLSPRAFKAVMDIDLLGSYHLLKATLPHLERSAAKYPATGSATPTTGTGGRLIFISATLQYRGTALNAHASSAKAGIDALSSCVAIEYGPRGLTSNIIAPGPIGGTEGMRRLVELGGESTSIYPSGRYGTVKEIADATIYLFADTGSYVNGTTLVVDGGAWRTQGAGSEAYPYPQIFLERKTKL